MSLKKEPENRKLPPKHRGDEKRHEENERFEKLLDKLEDMTTKGRLKDIAFHFTDKREVIRSNLIAGIARGVGLTIGAGIFIALLVLILSQLVSLPLVGEWIADLLDVIDANR
ncbi:DUF5665 domain-containing protein [Shouchella shacheensis]|uniref:DUF5665 domain-containing protein n=1 Tax=Shouchella shacheensis TaxID=1649580 RepID=UPI000740311E|nr:DUF5665 domain-containing protein [Shouchella shacheensis]